MILNTKEDFEKAVLSGEEIKHSTVFYTGELAESKSAPQFGEVNKDGFVYIGTFKGIQLWIYKFDAPEQLTLEEAQNYVKQWKCQLPTIDQLTFTYLFKDEVNAALKAAGGEPFKEDDYYWSSSAGSGSSGSWALHMGNGFRYGYNKNAYTYVRSFQLIEN